MRWWTPPAPAPQRVLFLEGAPPGSVEGTDFEIIGLTSSKPSLHSTVSGSSLADLSQPAGASCPTQLAGLTESAGPAGLAPGVPHSATSSLRSTSASGGANNVERDGFSYTAALSALDRLGETLGDCERK